MLMLNSSMPGKHYCLTEVNSWFSGLLKCLHKFISNATSAFKEFIIQEEKYIYTNSCDENREYHKRKPCRNVKRLFLYWDVRTSVKKIDI